MTERKELIELIKQHPEICADILKAVRELTGEARPAEEDEEK